MVKRSHKYNFKNEYWEGKGLFSILSSDHKKLQSTIEFSETMEMKIMKLKLILTEIVGLEKILKDIISI